MSKPACSFVKPKIFVSFSKKKNWKKEKEEHTKRTCKNECKNRNIHKVLRDKEDGHKVGQLTSYHKRHKQK